MAKTNVMHAVCHTDDEGNVLQAKLRRAGRKPHTYHPAAASRERLAAVINRYVPDWRHVVKERNNTYHFTLVSEGKNEAFFEGINRDPVAGIALPGTGAISDILAIYR